MNKIKCKTCGVVNWATVEQCIRCKNLVLSEVGGHVIHAPRGLPLASYTNWKTIGTSFLCLVFGLGMAFLIYTVAKRPTAKKPSAISEAPAAANQALLSETAPPPEFNVTQPRIEVFSKLVRDELAAQNGVWAKDAASTPVTHDDLIKECSEGVGTFHQQNLCGQSLTAQRYNADFNDPTKFCRGKVEGTPHLIEAGKYHRFDKDIFFVVKVSADGEDDVPATTGCATKKSPGPLTAKVHLRWSDTAGSAGYKMSSEGVFVTSNMEYNERNKVARKEEREGILSERWAQSGREEANRRMQTNKLD